MSEWNIETDWRYLENPDNPDLTSDEPFTCGLYPEHHRLAGQIDTHPIFGGCGETKPLSSFTRHILTNPSWKTERSFDEPEKIGPEMIKCNDCVARGYARFAPLHDALMHHVGENPDGFEQELGQLPTGMIIPDNSLEDPDKDKWREDIENSESMIFEEAWSIAKESGPPLNNINPDKMRAGEEVMPREGYQDFRFPTEGTPSFLAAGNFPDLTNYYPTRYTHRTPDGSLLTTLEPAGSNINLNPLAHVMHSSMYGNDMSGEGEEKLIEDLSSTGRHEAVHQAVHSILTDMGYKAGGPFGGTADEREKYLRATEWAANLAQYHDVKTAWNNLRRHGAFKNNEGFLDPEIDMLAEMYIDRDYDLNNDDVFPEERGGWERTIR